MHLLALSGLLQISPGYIPLNNLIFYDFIFKPNFFSDRHTKFVPKLSATFTISAISKFQFL